MARPKNHEDGLIASGGPLIPTDLPEPKILQYIREHRPYTKARWAWLEKYFPLVFGKGQSDAVREP